MTGCGVCTQGRDFLRVKILPTWELLFILLFVCNIFGFASQEKLGLPVFAGKVPLWKTVTAML